ncbi:MAG: DUF6036 family nucleotidyltransferase [Actinomycetota bacterium]
MRRSDLAHILRAATEVSDDGEILVIGSQAILAAYSETELPPEATVSIEADIAFLDDSDDEKADRVDGAIGEASMFHSQFGYYGQGVGLATATLPGGWEDRLVPFEWGDTGKAKAVCLEPHDLVLAKLVAGREKDREFADALIGRGLVDPEILLERVETLPVVGAIKRRVRTFIERRMDNT